jgi:hypothetical protein
VQVAVRQAEFGSPVDSDILRDLSAAARALRAGLRKDVPDLVVDDYLEAKTFLDRLDDAVTALRRPDAAEYLTGKYTLTARTVPELVRYMQDQGLRFAPADLEGHTAYLALHHALADSIRTARP